MNEGGLHSWQRVPPTERKGRTQTSLISVAVLPERKSVNIKISPKDIEIKASVGQGPGGQHRNKTESAITIKHLPTGITAYSDQKSQEANKKMAMAVLKARLAKLQEERQKQDRNKKRQKQVGKNKRGGKRRTVSEKRNEVVDHITNKKMKYKKYSRGFLEDLHK